MPPKAAEPAPEPASELRGAFKLKKQLIDAAMVGDVAKARAALDGGANCDYTDEVRGTPPCRPSRDGGAPACAC